MPIEGVTFENITFTMSDDPDIEPVVPGGVYGTKPTKGAGFLCTNVKDIEFHGVRVMPAAGPALRIDAGQDIEIDGFGSTAPCEDAPVVRLKDVAGAIVRGCRASEGTGTFLEVSGPATRDVLVTGNNLARAEEGVTRGQDLPEGAVVEQ